MHYKSSSNLTKLYTVVINCSAGHCFNILDNTSTPSSLEKHFSQSQPKSFHRLLSLDADSEQLGPTQPPGRRAPPPWQLAMPALDSSLPATISTIAASHPQRHAVPLQHNSPPHAMVLDRLPYCKPNREKRATAIHAGRAWHQQPLLPLYRMSLKRTNP